jgi:hypothetical protein
MTEQEAFDLCKRVEELVQERTRERSEQAVSLLKKLKEEEQERAALIRRIQELRDSLKATLPEGVIWLRERIAALRRDLRNANKGAERNGITARLMTEEVKRMTGALERRHSAARSAPMPEQEE